MSTVDQAKQITFDAGFIPDKIIYRYENTYSVPIAASIGDYVQFSVPHGLSFAPLLLGSYSDDNFVTSYDFGSGPYENLPTYGFSSYSLMAHVWSDSTNVYIRIQSHNVARTVKVHIIGLFPHMAVTGPIDIPKPPVQDDLLFTTDTNTLKHLYAAVIPITTNGLGTYVHSAFTSVANYPITMLPFVVESGRVSYGNTINSIVPSGVEFAAMTNSNFFQLSVSSGSVKTVNIIFKGYLDG